MNNKGFTLVELIAIIIIISVITILSFSSLTGSLKNTELKEIEDYKTKVEVAAQLYVETNYNNFLADYPDFENYYAVELSIYELVDSGYLRADIEVEDKCTFYGTTIYVIKNYDNTITYEIRCDDE